MALGLLARRRRWLRWAAVILAVLAMASALSRAVHRTASRAAAVPAVAARRALRAGQIVSPADLEVRMRPPGVAVPAGAAGRPSDLIGRVAARDLRAGETMTPKDVVPVLRYYGVAARVPPGMRAINLVLPPAATFGGELAPRSRVDLIGAFEPDRADAAVAVLATGFVLRLAAAHGPAAPGAAPLGVASPAAGSQAAPVEIVVAVPEAREREVALAQAFGRIFVAVHSAFASPAHAAGRAVLMVRRYLGLPSPRAGAWTGGPVSGIGVVPSDAPRGSRAPAASWCCRAPAPASAGSHPTSARGAPAPGARPGRRGAGPRAGGAPSPPWVVDVIEGGRRFYEAVPRADGLGRPSAPAGGGGR